MLKKKLLTLLFIKLPINIFLFYFLALSFGVSATEIEQEKLCNLEECKKIKAVSITTNIHEGDDGLSKKISNEIKKDILAWNKKYDRNLSPLFLHDTADWFLKKEGKIDLSRKKYKAEEVLDILLLGRAYTVLHNENSLRYVVFVIDLSVNNKKQSDIYPEMAIYDSRDGVILEVILRSVRCRVYEYLYPMQVKEIKKQCADFENSKQT